MDPTGHDELAFWLAYIHPAWMLTTIAIVYAAFRKGQAMRRARLRGTRREPAWRRQHLRLAKLALVLLVLGFVDGVASAWFLRAWSPLQTLHAWVGIGTLTLFATLGFTGRALEQGRSREVSRHGWIAVGALLAAGLAFATGFVLLP